MAMLIYTILIFLHYIGGTLCTDDDIFPYKDIRLPGNIVPVEYTLFMHPNITDGTFDFSGNIDILIDVKEGTDSVILHSKSLNHFYIGVREYTTGKDVPISKTLTHKKHEFIMLQLTEILSTSKQYILKFVFGGRLSSELHGFYKSSYINENGKTKFLATTGFEATFARLAFPCFDEPNMKARFTVTMVREKQHTALSNMPVERQFHRPDGLVEDHFRTSVKMSTYLVAFVVCDFAHLSARTTRGVQVRVWAPKHLISQASYAMQVTPKILQYYEKFFKIDFPLPKQDLIAIPDYDGGAMENWGLITYRLTALLYDEKESSAANKQRVAEVIAHELAHQWFGNLATMKWWNDVWLNEGFATFVQYIGASLVGGTQWKMMDQFVNDNVHRALAADSNSHSHPISVSVKDPADIGSLIDVITYQKGSSVIRMMRDFIGENRFSTGLVDYLRKYAYRNANSDDLFRCLSEETGHKVDVKVVMDTWIKQMGYPVVTVTRDRRNKLAVVTQHRFLSENEADCYKTSSPFNYTWEIPLTYYFQHDRHKQRKWLHRHHGDSVVIPWDDKNGWVKFNVDQIGFYRVNYDNESWKLLTRQLTDDFTELSDVDRANLIDDAFALANAGQLDITRALDVTRYLVNEKHYIPFSSGLSSLGFIGNLLRHRRGYLNYEKYILSRIATLYDTLGWDDRGSHLQKFLRAIVLQKSVVHNNSDAVSMGTKLFKEWMVGGRQIPVNIRAVVYMAGIKYGGKKEWMAMFEKFLSSKYPSERTTLMYSLTYTSDANILKWYLESSINSSIIRSQDTNLLIAKVAANPIAVKMSRDFIVKNWGVLLKRNYLGHALRVAFGGGTTDVELKETRAVFTIHELGSNKRTAQQILSDIMRNIDWLKKNEIIVSNWLKQRCERDVHAIKVIP